MVRYFITCCEETECKDHHHLQLKLSHKFLHEIICVMPVLTLLTVLSVLAVLSVLTVVTAAIVEPEDIVETGETEETVETEEIVGTAQTENLKKVSVTYLVTYLLTT